MREPDSAENRQLYYLRKTSTTASVKGLFQPARGLLANKMSSRNGSDVRWK